MGKKIAAPGKNLPKPEKELKAFAKTRLLAPGESQALTLRVRVADFASFDEERSQWSVEPGKYEARWGSSSQDIRLKQTFKIEEEILGEKVHRILLPKRELHQRQMYD